MKLKLALLLELQS